MMIGVTNIRVPPAGWKPEGFDPAEVEQKSMVTTADVSAANAIKTRQFWLLWTVLFCNVTAGIGILEQAAPMIQDFFRDSVGGSSSVTVAAAGGFVGLLSLFNMAGRFVWSSTSDYIGRKPIYLVYLGVGILLYLALALTGSAATAVFVLVAAIIISFYGGGFSTVPAYLRDLFGVFQVGAIHGRLLTAWSAAGVAGPLIINGFLDSAGGAGTLTSDAYRPALFTMVGVLAVGLLANLLITPVDPHYHEDLEDHRAQEANERQAGLDAEQELTPASTSARLVVSWAVASALLLYGVYQTATTAVNLFS
ncbi:MAG: MFS transporter [Nocardioides sp.]